MSRLQAGVLSVQTRPVALDEVVARALLHAVGGADDDGPRVSVEVADDLPLVLADAGLLERVVANLVSNALRAATTARRAAAVPAQEAGMACWSGVRRCAGWWPGTGWR